MIKRDRDAASQDEVDFGMRDADGFQDVLNGPLAAVCKTERFFPPGMMQEIVQFFIHPYSDRFRHAVGKNGGRCIRISGWV